MSICSDCNQPCDMFGSPSGYNTSPNYDDTVLEKPVDCSYYTCMEGLLAAADRVISGINGEGPFFNIDNKLTVEFWTCHKPRATSHMLPPRLVSLTSPYMIYTLGPEEDYHPTHNNQILRILNTLIANRLQKII